MTDDNDNLIKLGEDGPEKGPERIDSSKTGFQISGDNTIELIPSGDTVEYKEPDRFERPDLDDQRVDIDLDGDGVITPDGNHKFAIDLPDEVIAVLARDWVFNNVNGASWELFREIQDEFGTERAIYEAVVNEALLDTLRKAIEDAE